MYVTNLHTNEDFCQDIYYCYVFNKLCGVYIYNTQSTIICPMQNYVQTNVRDRVHVEYTLVHVHSMTIANKGIYE